MSAPLAIITMVFEAAMLIIVATVIVRDVEIGGVPVDAVGLKIVPEVGDQAVGAANGGTIAVPVAVVRLHVGLREVDDDERGMVVPEHVAEILVGFDVILFVARYK